MRPPADTSNAAAKRPGWFFSAAVDQSRSYEADNADEFNIREQPESSVAGRRRLAPWIRAVLQLNFTPGKR